MTKLRKQRKRKVYRHNVNRKRLRNKICKLGNIGCKEIKAAWDRKKSAKVNIKDMGLSSDPNETIKLPSIKTSMKMSMMSNNGSQWQEEAIIQEISPTKVHVAQALEEEARAPRVKLFRLPNSHVQWVTYLLDKYGTDYKAMARDKKNHYQETWKQIRAKIVRFKSIPEQYNKYLEATENNLSE